MLLDALLHENLIGHEEVVSDELDFVAEFSGELLPAGPVIFTESVFDGDERVLLDEVSDHIDHLFAGLLALSAPLEDISVLFGIIEFRGGEVHAEANIFARNITGSLDGFNENLKRLFVAL